MKIPHESDARAKLWLSASRNLNELAKMPIPDGIEPSWWLMAVTHIEATLACASEDTYLNAIEIEGEENTVRIRRVADAMQAMSEGRHSNE